MRTRSSVLVITKPLTVSPVLALSSGSTRQIYDNSTGVYTPDRQSGGTSLQMQVIYTDPNTGNTGQATITSVEWYEISLTGVKTRITGSNTSYQITGANSSVIRVLKNVPEGQSGIGIEGVARYTNPSTGASQFIKAKETLTTVVSAVSALSLNIEPVAGNVTYAGRVCLINPILTPLNAAETNWKRKCRVQLRDGTVALADAHTIGSSADAARTGNAFYFWYYRQNGQLIRLLENNDWFEAEYYADGTMSREVTVNLAKIKDVELVCKAGYIPYGELADYVDGDGIIQPSKCFLGYLRESFKLRVALPIVQRAEVVSLAHPVLERSDIGNSAVQIIRRLLLTCGGSVVNDMTLGTTPPWPDTAVDSLFDITWYAVYGGQSVAIGTGEFLSTNGANLLTALRTIDNNLVAGSIPAVNFEVEYEPKYPLLTGNNYVEGYVAGSSSVVPTTKIGNRGWLNNLDFYLLDTTDNDQEDTEGLLLRRNNLLRFAGGGWAPVVHISAAQAADATLQLFRKNGSGNYVEYCAAGEYDAEEYVENVLRLWYAGTLSGWESPKLYKSNGSGGYTEAHALLPWESTDTKWTIGIGYSQGMYLLDQVQGASGTIWKGLFTDVTEWDGIDLTPYYLAPTAVSPCPVATITEGGIHKTRNLFFLTQGETNCAGSVGLNNVSGMFKQDGRTYPRVNDVSAVVNMNYARNNNAVATSPVPFAEGGYHARNVMVTAIELLYSRKNPFRASQFGSGISSNDECSSLATWRENGGVRARVNGTSNFSYYKWESTTPFYYNASAKRSNFSETMNEYHPKEQCMESQLAASFAAEFGITVTTNASSPIWFEMYGGRYYYMNVDGAKTLAQGYMNVRVYKELTETINVWDVNGSAVTYDVEAVLRMSLFGGLNISGDIFDYCQGGAECIGTCLVSENTSRTGNKYDVYLITDQRNWVRDTTVDLGTGNALIEQSAHAIKVGTCTQVGGGYAKSRISYSPVKSENGGDLSSWQCYYAWTDNYWNGTVGRRARVGLRFRGIAAHAYCSPRIWNGSASAAHTTRSYGGSAQARLRKRS